MIAGKKIRQITNISAAGAVYFPSCPLAKGAHEKGERLMPAFATTRAARFVPNSEDKMKLLVALTRALNNDFETHTKTPAQMKAAGVKNLNA